MHTLREQFYQFYQFITPQLLPGKIYLKRLHLTTFPLNPEFQVCNVGTSHVLAPERVMLDSAVPSSGSLDLGQQ